MEGQDGIGQDRTRTRFAVIVAGVQHSHKMGFIQMLLFMGAGGESLWSRTCDDVRGGTRESQEITMFLNERERICHY